MTIVDLINNILLGQYVWSNFLLIGLTIIGILFFCRRIIFRWGKKMFANSELKKDLKENDFFHTNKALLLLSKGVLKGNRENEFLFDHIKDTILETTPDCKKEEIKEINF
jgi:hypothetical protein